MKDNFLLKKSHRDIFKSLSNEDAGVLIKGIYDYVCDGKSNLKGYLSTIFIPIKQEIDRNEKSYQIRCEINKNNGLKGGAPKGNSNAKKDKTTETTENNQTEAKTNENNMNSHNHIHIHNHTHKNINNKLTIYKNIINYLNNKTNSKFKYTSKSSQQKIDARLNEGYNLNDFIAVIDKKYNEWVGTEFEKYLCPETLFGTKFEKYLNQKVVKNREPANKDCTMEILKEVYNGTIKID